MTLRGRRKPMTREISEHLSPGGEVRSIIALCPVKLDGTEEPSVKIREKPLDSGGYGFETVVVDRLLPM